MLTQDQLMEIKGRIQTADGSALMSEVERLSGVVAEFTLQVNRKLGVLEEDMLALEQENVRLRAVSESTGFERDACISLISKMALQLEIPVGKGEFAVGAEKQNRVVVDLPAGQVSWDYLDSEAHLFEELPEYQQALQDQSVRDIYTKIMNPSLG